MQMRWYSDLELKAFVWAVMLTSKPWAPSACFFCIAVSTTVMPLTHNNHGDDVAMCLDAMLEAHLRLALRTQVAYTIGWTAVSSELTYYTSLFGPEILLWLNVSNLRLWKWEHGSCNDGTAATSKNDTRRWHTSCRLCPL